MPQKFTKIPTFQSFIFWRQFIAKVICKVEKYLLKKITNLFTKVWFVIIYFLFADGPILVHTTFGDLLRSLDTPEKMNSPTNLALSREGFVVANFPGGHVVAFTANGNRLRHEIHNDHIQVCCEIFLYFYPVF